MNHLQEQIVELKKQKNAIILAHNYQAKEILEIADFVGDSYDLSKKAQATDAEIIVFCGVEFQAEAAKLLNPTKKVLIPSNKAGCFMANKIDVEDLRVYKKQLKEKYPDLKVVAYINTYADVKAESDVCCTSANALEIVEKIDSQNILFVPDRNLAAYVQTKTSKNIIPWEAGYCFLHTNLSPEKIEEYRKQYPNAEVLMHPETPLKLHEHADFILGTGGMIKRIPQSSATTFLIATEEHMCGALELKYPDKTFIPLMKHCTFMGQITLENTLEALQKETFEVSISAQIEAPAKAMIMKMLELTN